MASNPRNLRDIAWRLDPVQFAQAANITPDPWQTRVLRSRADRLLLNVTRQGGKSTISSVLGLHTALYMPESLVLILSPSERQSTELFRKLMTVYRALGRPVRPLVENVHSLELANGSRIVALPGSEDTTRGFSAVRLLLIDEASKVADALYRSVRPMLATSNGRLVAMSTPFGKRGWWHAAWEAAKGGTEDWETFEVTASQIPRITAAFLAEEHASLGDLWYSQEYFCAFINVMSSLFSPDAIDAAFADGDDSPFFDDPSDEADGDDDSEDFAL